jgi:hypothetical protein|tara:strand:- start:999 stop:1565 length:567 start_codon:yes stop_codon:yes gene_type:complete
MALGGGGGQTIPHTHSAAPQDGGFLVEGTTGFSGGVVGEVLTRAVTSVPNWSAAGGGLTTNRQHDSLTSDFSTTSTTAVSMGLTLTATTAGGGSSAVLCCGTWWGEPVDDHLYSVLYDDGSAISGTLMYQVLKNPHDNARWGWCMSWAIPTDGSVLVVRAYVVAGATVAFAGTSSARGTCSMTLNEVY